MTSAELCSKNDPEEEAYLQSLQEEEIRREEVKNLVRELEEREWRKLYDKC